MAFIVLHAGSFTYPGHHSPGGWIGDEMFGAIKSNGEVYLMGQLTHAYYGWVSERNWYSSTKKVACSSGLCAYLDNFGQIKTWGAWGMQGKSPPANTYAPYSQIFATQFGNVVAWTASGKISWSASSGHGGPGLSVGPYLPNIATARASFAAIKLTDGTIYCPMCSVVVDTAAPTRAGYASIVGNELAYAALHSDGTIDTFGQKPYYSYWPLNTGPLWYGGSYHNFGGQVCAHCLSRKQARELLGTHAMRRPPAAPMGHGQSRGHLRSCSRQRASLPRDPN